MERIAPLAKILAEANGIEWEHLSGTGAGGQIVEQDILDYLSRVMSGEAEPPSTPVDAPPPDWNGEDTLPDMSGFDTSALQQAGVESDLTDYMQQSRSAAPATPAAATPALDTDDFELEDEPVAEPEPAAPAPTTPVHTEPAHTEPAHTDSNAGAAVAGAAAGAAAGGLGSLLSRLYHKEESAPEAAAPTPAETPAPVAAPAAMPEPVAPAVAETPAPAAAPAFTMPSSFGTTSTAAPVQPEPVAAPAPVQPEPVQPAPVAAPEPVAPAMPAPVSSPAPVSAPAAAPVVSGPTSEVPRDAVWFGTYLRRDADVKNLADLQGQLSEALERDVPLALLVARAAQRHAAMLNLGSVATQDVQAGKARNVQTGGLREAVGNSSDFDGKPDLLVVDAGSLGLDDLHYPETLSLSVGRVQDGRASLSIQGDVDTAKAAQFLNAVAETLAKPVILLV